MRKPHSLMALLRQLKDPIDLGTRFTIAKQLVASVYTIHACGLLHKNIRPSSILFLPAESADRGGGPSKSRRVQLGKPYLMGWGFTRPDDATMEPNPNDRRLVVTRDKEIGIYQHPERLKHPNRPYRRVFDIYSLGLILLEIGLWQSVESFVGGITDFTTEEFRGFLRKRVVPDLIGQVGSVYAGVVQECLSLRVDEDREDVVEKTLIWDIAARLATVHA
jgi:serine/threonine protein kinase